MDFLLKAYFWARDKFASPSQWFENRSKLIKADLTKVVGATIWAHPSSCQNYCKSFRIFSPFPFNDIFSSECMKYRSNEYEFLVSQKHKILEFNFVSSNFYVVNKFQLLQGEEAEGGPIIQNFMYFLASKILKKNFTSFLEVTNEYSNGVFLKILINAYRIEKR